MARIQLHKKQQCSKRDVPNKPDTRQHLKRFYFTGQAPPTVIYTETPKKKKRSRDFPERVVQPCALDLDSEPPSGVVTGSRAARPGWSVSLVDPSLNTNTTTQLRRQCPPPTNREPGDELGRNSNCHSLREVNSRGTEELLLFRSSYTPGLAPENFRPRSNQEATRRYPRRCRAGGGRRIAARRCLRVEEEESRRGDACG